MYSVSFFLLTIRASQKKGQKGSLARCIAVVLVCYAAVFMLLLLWRQGDSNYTFRIYEITDGAFHFTMNPYTAFVLLFFGVGYGAACATADMPILWEGGRFALSISSIRAQ